MSLHLDFEPHSWYKQFAIKHNPDKYFVVEHKWEAYTENGNSYRVDMVSANTLKELKQQITEYHA